MGQKRTYRSEAQSANENIFVITACATAASHAVEKKNIF